MAPRVSRDDRLRIIKLSKGGMPMRAISAEIGCALGTVLRVVRAYRDEGRVSDASRAGRRRATTEHEDLMIVAAVVDEPFLSAAEIKEELGIPASEATVRARLREAGLTCWNSNTKLRLSPGFKEIRLKFASEHRGWTVAQWQDWPPKCEDLSPIRSAWGLLKERLWRRRLSDPSPDKLWALIKKEWDKLRELPNITGGFYMALPDKMAEVVAAKGGATAFRETGDEGAGQDSLELATSANGAVLLNSG
ncbi:transposable element Uhu, putative [Ixodes scapularis]|uniref:Transposable element Uhu, putative n=1 Tax=Ixodes scapularis TaxID=6945 RepID=B7PX29_IXOSC|nr:transposable element Uhu, putative [Ixodes scapularis]|eukprot:XP_002410483.1 transposable element Uhu, putative [Ixodes scapularis]